MLRKENFHHQENETAVTKRTGGFHSDAGQGDDGKSLDIFHPQNPQTLSHGTKTELIINTLQYICKTSAPIVI